MLPTENFDLLQFISVSTYLLGVLVILIFHLRHKLSRKIFLIILGIMVLALGIHYPQLWQITCNYYNGKNCDEWVLVYPFSDRIVYYGLPALGTLALAYFTKNRYLRILFWIIFTMIFAYSLLFWGLYGLFVLLGKIYSI